MTGSDLWRDSDERAEITRSVPFSRSSNTHLRASSLGLAVGHPSDTLCMASYQRMQHCLHIIKISAYLRTTQHYFLVFGGEGGILPKSKKGRKSTKHRCQNYKSMRCHCSKLLSKRELTQNPVRTAKHVTGLNPVCHYTKSNKSLLAENIL